MTIVQREQEIEFACHLSCGTWYVEGRFNAEGKFEPTDEEDIICVDCESPCKPSDPDVVVIF
jgi:hypothetical protein